jgi:hypothetical protein
LFSSHSRCACIGGAISRGIFYAPLRLITTVGRFQSQFSQSADVSTG